MLEAQVPRSAGEKATERWRELRHLILTAILFGLGVNLLSDFIYNLPVSIGNTWSVLMLVLSLLITAGVGMLLVFEYMGESSRLHWDFTSILAWDPMNGMMVRFDSHYIPQVVALFLVSRFSRAESDRLFQSLKGDFNDISSFEMSSIRGLFQKTLSYLLGDPEFLRTNPPPHRVNLILFGNDYTGPEMDLSLLMKRLPSHGPISWHDRHNKGFLRIVWKRGLVGSFTITVSSQIRNTDYPDEILEKVDFLRVYPKMNLGWLGARPPTSRLMMAEFSVRAEARFSRVFLTLTSARKRLSVLEDILSFLVQEVGCHEKRAQIVKVKQVQEAMRQSRGQPSSVL